MIAFRDSYHIAGTKGVFYAREPYSNADAVHVTRFIGLAPVGNKEKQVNYPSLLCVIDHLRLGTCICSFRLTGSNYFGVAS